MNVDMRQMKDTMMKGKEVVDDRRAKAQGTHFWLYLVLYQKVGSFWKLVNDLWNTSCKGFLVQLTKTT